MANIPAPERRRMVIDAAIKVIVAEGPSRTTTRRVAAMADAPLASLHYLFRDKEDLFHAVIERCLDIIDEEYRNQAQAGPTLREAVAALIRFNIDWTRDAAGFNIATYELFFWSLRTPSANGFAQHIYRRWFEVIGRHLAACSDANTLQAQDLERLIRAAITVIDGIVLQIIAFGETGPQLSDVDRLVEMVIAAVC